MYRRTNKHQNNVTLIVKPGEAAHFSLIRMKRLKPMLPIPLHAVFLVLFLLQDGDGMSKLYIFNYVFLLTEIVTEPHC